MFPTKASFVKWNKTVFSKDDLSDEEQRLLRQGMLQHHPKLRGLPPDAIGAIHQLHNCISDDRCWVATVQGELQTLPRKCIAKSPQQRLNAAMRDAVKDQINAVRIKRGHEVDHCGPGFSQLLQKFMDAHGLHVQALLPFVVRRDRFRQRGPRCQRKFYDVQEPWRGRWRRFHLKHAKLESVTRAEHRRRTRARLTPPASPPESSGSARL